MRSSMMRVLLLALVVGLIVPGTGIAQTEVVHWSFPLLENEEERLWKPVVEQFNEIYPDIRVNVQIMPWAGRDERMLTAVVSGNPPDVVYLNEFFLQAFTSRGALEPLDNHIPVSVLQERFPEPLLNTGQQDGHYYLAPTLTSVVGTIYNREIVEAAGWDVDNLPSTWDEFLEFCQVIKDYAANTGQQIWPVGYSAGLEATLNMSLFPFIWQAGGDILTPDLDQAAFNSPEGFAALEFVQTLAHEEYIPRAMITTGEGDDYFVGQRLAALMSVDAPQIDAMRQRDPEFDRYTVVGPVLQGERRITYGTLGAWAIFRQARNLEAGAKWIEFLTRPEVNIELNRITGFMSPIVDAPALFGDDPLLGVLESQSIYARGGMVIEEERRVMDVLKRAQQAVMLGQQTIEQALAEAEQEVNFILR